MPLSRWAVHQTVLGRLGTALAARAVIAERQRHLRQLWEAADRVIAVSDWLRVGLAKQGIDEQKLVLCRQGAIAPDAREMVDQRPDDGVLRIAFIGRWDPTKGLPVLLAALDGLPRDAKVELIVRCPPPAAEFGPWRTSVMKSVARDPRILVEEGRPRSELRRFFARVDLLAVPSQSAETGPMVVLEAHAFGVPVLASDLFGLRELIDPGRTGWLVPFNRPKAFADVLVGLLGKRVPRLSREQVARVRHFDAVAVEMEALYASLAPSADDARGATERAGTGHSG